MNALASSQPYSACLGQMELDLEKNSMQDNAGIHKAKKVMDWLEENGIEVVKWPLHSPDSNLIGHIWRKLKEWVHEHYSEFCAERGKSDDVRGRLIVVLHEGWNALPEEFFDNLVRSMERRVKAVKNAKDWCNLQGIRCSSRLFKNPKLSRDEYILLVISM